MTEQRTTLAKKYHDAVEHWTRHNFPDYPKLAPLWDTYFPKDETFCLCARIQEGMPTSIEVGDRKGQPKANVPAELDPEAAVHLLPIIRAQASTEFGSIQQHQPTLARAADPQDQAWVLRVMAEELRHGYQMVHLLTTADWSGVTDVSPDEMVEEILSMQTGSHVLAAFNVEFDSFTDNVVFAGLIDRVGKYQLTMQKVNAYKPMAASMPPMLKEEAFHLAAGVVPMRRWMEQAARNDPLITVPIIQKTINKWLARGLEMFGDERGGQTNVKYGLKDFANGEAQQRYYDEVGQVIDDLNLRWVRARFADKGREEADRIHATLKAGGSVEGVTKAELLYEPDKRFFRRRGEFAFQMIGVDGTVFADVEAYLAHAVANLPEQYRASTDVKHWATLQRGVFAGTIPLKEAMSSMPRLQRVGGTCPCANSVRWVVGGAGLGGGAETLNP